MRHKPIVLAPIVLALLLLAACSDSPQPAVLQPSATAAFPPGGVINVIRVDTRDRLPLRAAELVAPDGSATPASYLGVDKDPQTLGGQNATNDLWRSSTLGANGVSQLPRGGLTDATVRSQNTVLLMASTADIPLADPVAYRRDWEKYRVRLSYDAGGGQLDVREIAAPQPPPG